MFPLLFLLFIIFDVTYLLLETLISMIRGRRREVDVLEMVMKRSITTRQLRHENVSIKTPERLVKRHIRRRNTHFRMKYLLQGRLTAHNTNIHSSNSEFYLLENKDQITSKDVLASRLKLSQPNIDICLTTYSRNALLGSSVLNTLLFGFPCYELDVSAAIQVVRVFDTMFAVVKTCLLRESSFDYPRRYKNHGERTRMEVVLYQPRHFHGLTFDLTVACDIARSMYKSIPSGPAIHIDYHRFILVDIPSELLAGYDGLPQIISEDTEVGDGKSCDGTISSCCQQQSEVDEPNTSHQRNEKHQNYQAILYDEDMIGPKSYAAPRDLIKWEDEGDVTDCDLDFHQVEGWDAADMLKTNEAFFNYQSTFNEAMPEYTTVLIKEDTPEYKLRWERACRLADDIESKKRSEREAQAKQRKKPKTKKRRAKNIITS